MRVLLVHPERPLRDLPQPPSNAQDLVDDLGLAPLFSAMAGGDRFVLDVSLRVVLASLTDAASVRYRQDVLRDCIAHPDLMRELYGLAVEFAEAKRKQWLWVSPSFSSASTILATAQRMLATSLDLLKRLRSIAERAAGQVESEGLRRFFAMLLAELDDEYLALLDRHVSALAFPRGVLLRAQLGAANATEGFTLCEAGGRPPGLLSRIVGKRSPVYSFTLHPRDDGGARILGEIRNEGVARAAEAAAQAANHVEGFFKDLQAETAFYVGCLDLHERLAETGSPVVFPEVVDAGETRFAARELWDAGLALASGQPVVASDVDVAGRPLAVITGPNRGGKTTFLRSVGIAQLLAQAGMFVPARSLSLSACTGLFTHFKRAEDESMRSGKLQEEMERMGAIVDGLAPGGLLLCNESFAATNEREGAEIAMQVVRALLDRGVRVVYVTHMYELARRFGSEERDRAVFLRAERLADGTRTFRIVPGEPLRTSHGMDVFEAVFGTPPRGPGGQGSAA